VWTVDDVARLIDFLNRILIYFTIGSMILRDDKNQIDHKTLLFIFYYTDIHNVSSSRLQEVNGLF